MKIIENLKQINNNIATIVEESFSELSKVRLNKNDFYYRYLNSKLNLNFGVFGENNLPCIGLKVKDQFLRYRVVNKYKVNNECPGSFGQRIIIILNDSKNILQTISGYIKIYLRILIVLKHLMIWFNTSINMENYLKKRLIEILAKNLQ